MISGNKGGVGKSLFCLALASALEMRSESFAVLDGDGRTGDVHAAFLRKIPSRWGDFRKLRPAAHDCAYDAEYESMLYQLLGGSDHLIVNTPDGADRVLMEWFDVTLSHTESHNHHFKFVYLMSDRPDGLEVLPELAQRFQFLYPVRNLYFGAPEIFGGFNQYLDEFHEVIDFLPLRGVEVRQLFDLASYPAEAMSLKRKVTGTHAVNCLSRKRFLAWQLEFNESIDSIISNHDVPNLKKLVWASDVE
jgi:hypothetical protein